MRNGIVFVVSILIIIAFTGLRGIAFSQAAVPDIKVNSSDGPVILSGTDTLNVSIALNNENVMDNADWWFAAATPFGFYFLTPNGWSTDIMPAYQGPLFNLPPVGLFSIPMSGFPTGTYAFYLAVDTAADGMITWERFSWDGVLVKMTDHPFEIALSEVPLEFHRRAAQLIEEMRMSCIPLCGRWESATLGPLVHLFYRPDVNGVAYYEFEVKPSGFILLSTGEHDFPVPQWSSEGETITNQLKQKAAQEGKVDVAGLKLFKLDALTYAAEDSQGELITIVGNQLARVSGMDPSWVDVTENPVSEVIAQPTVKRDGDQDVSGINYSVQKSGETPADIQFSEWQSWRQLKAGYSESYNVFIESLRRDALEDWKTEKMARDFGEGLVAGETYRLALLYPGSEIKTSGEGTNFAQVQKLDSAAAEIRVLSTPPGSTAKLNVAITYENGLSENLKFVIIDSSQLNTAGVSKNIDVSSQSEVRNLAASNWNPWTFAWAGAEGDQRLYHQFNIGNCPSGCGATAWAMLFGWGDHQAALNNSYWQARIGLYYQNGGKWTSPDADAPRFQDSGIENITKEIAGYIGSVCWTVWGPTTFTLPWEMDEA